MKIPPSGMPTVQLVKGVEWINECFDLGERHLHVSLYLIRAETHNIVVDTGSFFHRENIRARLKEATGGQGVGALILTHADYDHSGNVRSIQEEWRDTEIVAASGLPQILGLPADATRSRIGGSLEVLGRRFSFIDPPLADRSHTSWIFDHVSGVLFTSDGFGNHHFLGRCNLTTRELPDGISVQDIYVFHRDTLVFLRYVDPALLMSRLNSIFDAFDVKFIAPVHGNPIAGEDIAMYLQRLEASVTRIYTEYRVPD